MSPPAASPQPPSLEEHRREQRSNIFVIATLYADGSSTPIRIRNMSRNGALIEGGLLPPAGSSIRLSRGSLRVTGEVVWLAGRRAGLRFAASVAVADWLPRGQRNSGQQYVDELVFQTKSGGSAAEPPRGAEGDTAAAAKAFDAAQLIACLEQLAEELLADIGTTATPASLLQMIDAAVQSLKAHAAGTTNPDAAVSPTAALGTTSLRCTSSRA